MIGSITRGSILTGLLLFPLLNNAQSGGINAMQRGYLEGGNSWTGQVVPKASYTLKAATYTLAFPPGSTTTVESNLQAALITSLLMDPELESKTVLLNSDLVVEPNDLVSVKIGSALVNQLSPAMQNILRFYLADKQSLTSPSDVAKVPLDAADPSKASQRTMELERRLAQAKAKVDAITRQSRVLNSRREAKDQELKVLNDWIRDNNYDGLFGAISYWFSDRETIASYPAKKAETDAKIVQVREEILGFVRDAKSLQSELEQAVQNKNNYSNALARLKSQPPQGWYKVERGAEVKSELAAFSCKTGLIAYVYELSNKKAIHAEPFGVTEIQGPSSPAILACADESKSIQQMFVLDRAKLGSSSGLYLVEIGRDEKGALTKVSVSDDQKNELESIQWSKPDQGQLIELNYRDTEGKMNTLAVSLP